MSLGTEPAPSPSVATLGLGLDAGGTQTRWALAEAGSGRVVAEGHVAGLSGMQLASGAGLEHLQRALGELAVQVLRRGTPGRVYAGFTGLPDTDASALSQMQALLAQALRLPLRTITCRSDMDIACRAAFAPGQGYLVYAGTGAIAAFIDAQGLLHRAGGRGAALGDEGGGYWIACQALAQIWRAEDSQPGAWRASAMARRIFEQLGGSDWALSRRFIYGSERGTIGQLALQVAASAEDDPAAAALLLRAGAELGRLADCLLQRFGPRPVLLAGRVQQLHPLLVQGLRQTLPADVALTLQADLAPQRAAARLALTLELSP